MPNLNDLKSSKFLTKADVEPPVLVTIKSYEEIDVSLESQATDMKWCLHFKELDKPMVLNMTNGQLIGAIAGSGEFDHWVGKQIVLYNDKTVMFAGQLTGGIRVRASKGGQPNPEHNGIPDPDPSIQKSPFCPHCGNPHKECTCEPTF